nr:NADH dehydrogenase subunit 5 [Bangiopsis subsimplex]
MVSGLHGLLWSIHHGLFSAQYADWVVGHSYSLSYGLQLDGLSIIMVVLVELVLLMVMLFSMVYMASEVSVVRFYGLLNAFAASMVLLVLVDNMVMLFLSWEMVGLWSYALISYYSSRWSASQAAIKAVLVNRVGDYGLFMVSIIMLSRAGSATWSVVFSVLPYTMVEGQYWCMVGSTGLDGLYMVMVFLLLATVGKSAQMGLHTWLPDAMEGPTPVSALLHAATMIVAGAFLALRCSPMVLQLAPYAGSLYWLGAVTAVYAALVGCYQLDIKRLIALSTCSHIALMLCALGAHAPEVALYHLAIHAGAKASLFMLAGAVIHGSQDEQDTRALTNAQVAAMALIWVLLVLNTGSLMGFPGSSGAHSKDAVILSTWLASAHADSALAHSAAPVWMLLSAVLFSASYSVVLVPMLFIGSGMASRCTLLFHGSGSTALMVQAAATVPLLSVSLLGGYLLKECFVGAGSDALSSSLCLDAAHDVASYMEWLPYTAKLTAPMLIVVALLVLPMLWSRTGYSSHGFSAARELIRWLGSRCYWDELHSMLFVLPILRGSYALLARLLEMGVLEWLGAAGIYVLAQRSNRAIQLLSKGMLSRHLLVLLCTAASIVWLNVL